jgi:hypothetical protein
MNIPFFEESHDLSSCHQDRIQELAEYCDHEYYMSALPHTTSNRAIKGSSNISESLEEFKRLLEITECKPCHNKIINQIMLVEEGLQEIETVWNIIKND